MHDISRFLIIFSALKTCFLHFPKKCPNTTMSTVNHFWAGTVHVHCQPLPDSRGKIHVHTIKHTYIQCTFFMMNYACMYGCHRSQTEASPTSHALCSGVPFCGGVQCTFVCEMLPRFCCIFIRSKMKGSKFRRSSLVYQPHAPRTQSLRSGFWPVLTPTRQTDMH